MARGTGTQGVANTPMFDNVQHAPVCRCARCKERGENGWKQAVATSSSAQVAAAPAATKVALTPQQKAAASSTPYCYNCGAVVSESERGQLCSDCTAEEREQGEAALKARNDALVEMQQKYADQPKMPSTGWPLGIPNIPVAETFREKPRIGVTVVFRATSQDSTVIGHCPGGMVDHIVCYHPDFSPKVTGYSDDKFWSACKYTPAQLKADRNAWHPIKRDGVTCSRCFEVYDEAGLLGPVVVQAQAPTLPAPEPKAVTITFNEQPKARETRVEVAASSPTPVQRAVATVNNEEVIRELATTLLGAVDKALLTLFDVQFKLSALTNTPTVEQPEPVVLPEPIPVEPSGTNGQPNDAVVSAAFEWARVRSGGGDKSAANKAAAALLRSGGLYPAAWNEMLELAETLMPKREAATVSA